MSTNALHARCLETVVERGNAQKLEADGRALSVPGHQRDGGREPTARRQSVHRDARGVDAELVAALAEPDEGRVAVIDGRRERMLRSEAVVHRGDGDSDISCHGDRCPVLLVVVPQDESAAVQVEHGGHARTCVPWPVDANRDGWCVVRPRRDRVVADLQARGVGRSAHARHALAARAPGPLGVLEPARAQRAHERRQLGVERVCHLATGVPDAAGRPMVMRHHGSRLAGRSGHADLALPAPSRAARRPGPRLLASP